MKNFKLAVFLLSAALAITGCTTARLNTDNSAQASEPRLASSEADLNKKYLWGGEILAVENLEDTTELTIISYPLDNSEKPKYSKQSTGRFIASHPGFLEPTDYHRGQLVTVIGTLREFKTDKVSQADYQFPVLAVEQIKLQGKASRGYRLPFTIGIGIGIHN